MKAKQTKSRHERILAAEKAKAREGTHNSCCPYCGYHIRGIGHFEGKHHNE